MLLVVLILFSAQVNQGWCASLEFDNNYSKAKYVEQKVTGLVRCRFESSTFFFCPYNAVDKTPPWPDKEKFNGYTECCNDKCCTKEQFEQFTATMKPDWCWMDFLPGFAGCD